MIVFSNILKKMSILIRNKRINLQNCLKILATISNNQ